MLPFSQDTAWLILIIAAMFVAIMLLRMRRRQSAPTAPLGSFGGSAVEPRKEIERLLADVQDLSREQIARLDTKIRMLRQLLLDCDQKKQELETLLGKTTEPTAPSSPRTPNPLHDQVYTLQDSGRDLLEICGSTGLEKGEVELILGLRKMAPPNGGHHAGV
jgi:hypothetical protein